MKYMCDECKCEVDAEEIITRYDLPMREVNGVMKAQQIIVWPGAVTCGHCGYQMGRVEEAVSGD